MKRHPKRAQAVSCLIEVGKRDNRPSNITPKQDCQVLERHWQNYCDSLKADPFDLGKAKTAWLNWVTAFVPGDGARSIPLRRLLVNRDIAREGRR
jgi:hypothetical protein